MMEPQIQYTQTSDGVNIAFASAGEGTPLVRVPLPSMNHVQRDWAMYPNFWPPLAEAFRLIVYDPRGTGLSDRDAIDFSMEAMVRDLEAVVDHLGLQSFAVVAVANAVPVAVTYAAISPDRVSHLSLLDGFTNPSDFIGTPKHEANEALKDQDWTLYTETLVRVLIGLDEPRLVESFGEHIRACIEPDAYRSLRVAAEGYDVSDLLPDVRAETLVLHNSDGYFPVRVGQKLAAGIPGARFVAIDDINYNRVAPLIEEFMGVAVKPASAEPSTFRTVLFTDLVGHTEMMQRLGDERGRDVLREHEQITRESLTEHGGDEVKTMGDGFMASFGSVTRAMDCAIALQQAFAEHNISSSEPLRVRVGLNAGEPIEEDGDLFGSTVIMASRIAAKADGGEILIPEPLRHLLTGKSYVYADRGETMLKGFEDAVRLYEVRWQADA